LETPADDLSHAPRKSRKPLQLIAYKVTLALYRTFAILTLYAVLIGILAYAFVMGFYAINTSWAAPVILSASDEKSLDFMQKLVISRQSIEDLKVDVVRQQTTLAEMDRYRASLLALDRELQTAIASKQAHDQLTGPELAELDRQKQADNRMTQELLVQIHQIETQINSDLAAGLITKGDAATQLAALNHANTDYTDSRIADVMLDDSILDKTTVGTKTLEALEKQAELRSDIAQLDVTLSVAENSCRKTTGKLTACTMPSPLPSRVPTISTPTETRGFTLRLFPTTTRSMQRWAHRSMTATSTWPFAARSAVSNRSFSANK